MSIQVIEYDYYELIINGKTNVFRAETPSEIRLNWFNGRVTIRNKKTKHIYAVLNKDVNILKQTK